MTSLRERLQVPAAGSGPTLDYVLYGRRAILLFVGEVDTLPVSQVVDIVLPVHLLVFH